MTVNPDLFEPYDSLIEISVNGEPVEVPSNNTILRCFQYLSVDTVSYGDFCWNGDCRNCRVRITLDGKSKEALACIVKAEKGMAVETISEEIELGPMPDVS